MKARVLNFRSGESHYPVRQSIVELANDAREQALRRTMEGDRLAQGLFVGENIEAGTKINLAIDLTRAGVQHTHSTGPSVEVIEPLGPAI